VQISPGHEQPCVRGARSIQDHARVKEQCNRSTWRMTYWLRFIQDRMVCSNPPTSFRKVEDGPVAVALISSRRTTGAMALRSGEPELSSNCFPIEPTGHRTSLLVQFRADPS
jgi:hypothetical protein